MNPVAIELRRAAGPRRSAAALCLALACVAAAGAQPWPESSPQEQGVSSEAIEAMVAHVRDHPRFSHSYALLVVRHGTLISETYFRGRDPEALNDLRSVTKSVLSLLTGIAIERGELADPQTLVREMLPSYAPLLAGRPQWELSIEHLLTMQAGLRWSDSAAPWLPAVFESPDLVEFVLVQPSETEPGRRFLYSTGLSQVLAKALIGATGMQPHDYARQHLFPALGIERSSWLVRPSGDDYGGLGMALRPRDQCRLGQLALQRGFWNGVQVVSEDWIDQSTLNRSPDPANGYGYRWWVPIQDAAAGRFVAIGYGGQYVDVDPATDTVICLTSEWNVPNNRHIALWEFQTLRDLFASGLLPEAPSGLRWLDAAGQPAADPVVVLERDEDHTYTLQLERHGAADGSLRLRLQTVRGSARPRSDYVPLLRELFWPAGDASPRPVEITVLADQTPEPSEDFALRATVLAGNATAPPDLALRIEEGPATLPTVLRWSSSEVAVVEGGSESVGLHREGDLGTELSVEVVALPVTTGADEVTLAVPAQGGGGSGALTLTFAVGEALAPLVLAASEDGFEEASEILELTVLGHQDLTLPPPLPVVVQDAGALDAECAPTAPGCLAGGRFRVEATWRDPVGGGVGSATPRRLGAGTVASSVAMTFFDPDNVELLIKLVDGGAINQHFWSYFGKLSDLDVWLVLSDRAARRVRVYRAPGGTLCGGADVEAFGSAPAPAVTAGPMPAAPLPRSSAPGLGTECPSDAICFHDRFEARVSWRDAEGVSHTGFPVVPGTSQGGSQSGSSRDSGSFWFFTADNVEVTVKVLDGRPLNQRFWIFGGSLTDLDYTVEVLDRSDGSERSYHHPAGDLCGFADTDAFD
ncbi:MAG: hypothetical protein DWQ36_17340 [Acidobacteria bacterium]|nr:MAG: hypothetical protein DWQ30_05435 [Acidobacteriota bacterium]REK04610.1 MAG: hypothetical protein DWQ36_17340 [Acidobacteriota bacterium]